MKKGSIRLYAMGCYAAGLLVTLYYVDFLGPGWFTSRIDTGVSLPWKKGLLINTLLMVLFGLQHTLMARTGCKQSMRQYISPHVERSTYVAITTIVLGLLIWQWQPVSLVIFNLEGTLWGKIIWGLYGLGWVICLFSTYLIDHFDLFGLRQAFWYGRGEKNVNTPFRTPSLYKIVRHPVYLGWLIIHWSTPHLTAGRVLLATGMTIYIFIGMHYEEKDLLKEFGDAYQAYQKSTSRIFPFLPTLKRKLNNETISV